MTKKLLDNSSFNDDTIRQMEMDKDYEAYCYAKGLSTCIIANDLSKVETVIDLSKYTGYSPTGESSTTVLISGTNNLVITTPYHIIDYLWKRVH